MIRLVATVLLLFVCGASTAQPPGIDEARRLLREGRVDDALTVIDARLAARSDDRQARFLKGVVLAEREQTEAAIEVFKALTRDHPELPEPYNNLAVLYAARGDYAQARDALLSAINTHSSYATAHENLGDIYAKMAGQAYSRALSLDTDNVAAQHKLALIDDLFMRAAPQTMTASAARTAPATVMPSPIAEPVIAVPERADTPAAPARADPAPRTADAPAPGTRATPVSIADRPVPPARAQAPAPARPRPSGVAAAPVASAATPQPRIQAPVHGGAIEAIQAWAAAWSAQDVPRYLAHYAAQGSPDADLDRQQWEAQRRVRLTRPADIKVDVDNFQVRSAGAQRVDVTFVQRYRSESYSDRVRKLLSLELQDGNWKIISERTLATL